MSAEDAEGVGCWEGSGEESAPLSQNFSFLELKIASFAAF